MVLLPFVHCDCMVGAIATDPEDSVQFERWCRIVNGGCSDYGVDRIASLVPSGVINLAARQLVPVQVHDRAKDCEPGSAYWPPIPQEKQCD